MSARTTAGIATVVSERLMQRLPSFRYVSIVPGFAGILTMAGTEYSGSIGPINVVLAAGDVMMVTRRLILDC